jgi:uncharacterized membrane protein YphA (DoxX/SURF4 family)
MDKLAPIGRLFFAVSLAAFGIQQFLWGDFVPGRAAAWPAGVPGGLVWAWLSGAALIGVAAAIVLGKGARGAAVLAAAMIFVWAFLRNIPPALADRIYGGAWTNLGKSLALFSGALAVAGSLPSEKNGRALGGFVDSTSGLFWMGRIGLGAFLASSGVQHFLFAAFVDSLVPTWIPPGARFWTCFAGVALIAGGVGLMIPWTARLAAALSGLMVFLWVFMVHLPRALAAPAAQLRNEWTAVFEALAVSGIAFVLTAPTRSRGERPPDAAA